MRLKVGRTYKFVPLNTSKSAKSLGKKVKTAGEHPYIATVEKEYPRFYLMTMQNGCKTTIHKGSLLQEWDAEQVRKGAR